MPLDIDTIDQAIEGLLKPKPGVSFARPGMIEEAKPQMGVGIANPSPKPISFMGPRPTPQDVPQPEQPFGAGPSGGGFSFAQPQPTKPAGNPADPSVKGAPSVSFAKRYEDAEAQRAQLQQPTREQFPAEKMPWWKKALGAASSVAAGINDPRIAGETAKQVFGAPQRKADEQFNRANEDFKNKVAGIDRDEAGIAKEATIADTESQAGLRDAQAKAAGQKDDQVLAKSGLRRDEQGNIVPMPDDQLPPEIRTRMANEQSLSELRESQQALAQAKLEMEKAKNDPNSPQFKLAQQKLAVEQQRTQQALAALGLHQEEFANKLNEQDLVKPGGATQSRGSQAQTILDVMPDLKNLVNKYRDKLGPWAGRLARGEITIGNVPPDIAKVFTAMESFNALQPAAHGFRSAEFVKDWKTALGSLERDPDAFIAGLEGLRPTMEKIATEGKTFHRRIVEPKKDAPATIIKYDSQGNRIK